MRKIETSLFVLTLAGLVLSPVSLMLNDLHAARVFSVGSFGFGLCYLAFCATVGRHA